MLLWKGDMRTPLDINIIIKKVKYFNGRVIKYWILFVLKQKYGMVKYTGLLLMMSYIILYLKQFFFQTFQDVI